MRLQTVALFLVSFSSLAATRTVTLPPAVNYAVGATVSSGELYVANLREATVGTSIDAVYVLDRTTGAMKRTLTQGRTLQHLDFDGTSLWAVKMYAAYERLSFAGAALETVRLPSSEKSIGFAFDRRAGVLWELAGFSSTALRLRDRSGAVLRTVNTVQLHDSWSGLAFDGCTLWTSDLKTDELVRLDPATGAELERMPSPSGALGQIEGLGFDGQTLIATDEKKNLVHFIDIAPKTCAPTEVPDAGTPGPVMEPDAGTPPPAEEPDAGTGEQEMLGTGGGAEAPVMKPFGNIEAEQRGCGCGAGGAAPLLFLLGLALARRRPRR